MLRSSMRKIALLMALLLSSPAMRAQTATNAPSNISTNAPLTANTATLPTRQISLSDVIQMAMQSNLDIQFQRYNPEIAQFGLSESLAVYEPSFRTTASRSMNKSAGGFDPNGRPLPSNIITEDNFGASVGQSVQGYTPIGLTYSIGGGLTK